LEAAEYPTHLQAICQVEYWFIILGVCRTEFLARKVRTESIFKNHELEAKAADLGIQVFNRRIPLELREQIVKPQHRQRKKGRRREQSSRVHANGRAARW